MACPFWMVSALHHVDRTDEARDLMDQLVTLTNDVGMLAEMIDPADSAFLGNLLQGLSQGDRVSDYSGNFSGRDGCYP